MSSTSDSALTRFALTFARFLAICAEGFYQIVRFTAGALVYSVTSSGESRRRRLNQLGALCFTSFFRNLGATFIKIGQILSARPDLLPPYMIEELQTLQDDVPPFPFAEARASIEAEFGCQLEKLFLDLDEKPIAAASVAQVHHGHLHDGTEVAIKIQRPKIATTMDRDLRIIRGFALALERIPGMKNIGPGRMSKEFSRKIEAQLDFPREVRNNRRFAEIFEQMPFVGVPEIYGDFSGANVITMEFIHGKKLTEILDNPPIDPAVMADRMIDIYLTMAFRHFFLHADLHPGNILVDDEGNYILIDTGLVHETPPSYARRFFLLYLSLLSQDGDLIVDTYLEGADITPERLIAAKRDTRALVKKYDGVSFSEFEIGQGLMEVFAILRRHRIFLDAELTGFFLSEITFEGIAKMLDSSLDLVNLVPGKVIHYVEFLDTIDADDPVVSALRERIESDEAIQALIARGFAAPTGSGTPDTAAATVD